jgi:hypothetical protein
MHLPNKPHHYDSVAGTMTEWWSSDSRAQFETMMRDPQHREYFREQGWDQPNGITYCFNRHGFRDETTEGKFSSKDNNLVALGCSFTMGLGLPWKDVWPTLMGRALNLRVCNFGWGGASSDRCFRLAEYWIPQLKPKLVVLLNPPRGRIEIVIDQETGEAHDMLPNNTDIDVFYKKWLVVDENQRLNNLKNCLAVEAICLKHEIPFLGYEADTWMSRSREIAGYARDYLHAGPAGHRSFTGHVLNEWSQKYV